MDEKSEVQVEQAKIRLIHGDWKRGRRHHRVLFFSKEGKLLSIQLKLRNREGLDEFIDITEIRRLRLSGGSACRDWVKNASIATLSSSIALVDMLRDTPALHDKQRVRFLLELKDQRYLCASAPGWVYASLTEHLNNQINGALS